MDIPRADPVCPFFCAKVLPRKPQGPGKDGGKTLPLAVVLTAA